jgi:mRNA (2'-O-methyladenosine-N6-)-methyltransferase
MNALGFLKSMVAACLLDHSTALPVESGAIYHRLVAKDMNLMERDAITEVGGGGETGGVAAVELALRSLADGPYGGGIEIDEFIVAGMPHLMVVNFDRPRLLKELPGGHPAHRMGDPHHRGGDPHLMSMGLGHGMDTNSGPLGMPARPPEMWVCGGEPRMQGGAPLAGPGSPMFPGGGGPPHMVPRGGPRGMGMLGMPGGGMGFGGLPSPFQRPPMGLGPHGLPGVKNRGGEEDDIDALLNKKSFKELQQSKTGEELLELLHRPTAKETAVAAKVGFEQSEGHHCIVLSGVHMLHDFDQRL